MKKTLAIAAITLVAVVMGMSAMAPAFAGIPVEEEEEEDIRCAALRHAQDKAVSEKAKDAIQEALDRLGCISGVPCPDNSSVPATLGITVPPCTPQA